MPGTDSFNDVIVLIPGILGSRLVRHEGKKDVTVWDFSITSLPRLLKEIVTRGLVLGSQDGPPDDDIEAISLFNYQWLPGHFGVDNYEPLIESLKKAVGSPQQLIMFPYDWRASNRFAAERLQSRALDALSAWQNGSGNADARLWFVCHSMGGLVARYFCEHLDGARHTRAVITFGTPHRGSARALDALSNGISIGAFGLSRLVRSLPSVYELLPLYPSVRLPSDDPRISRLRIHRVGDFFALDPVTGADAPAVQGLAPIANLDRVRVKRALEFHAKIRQPAEARAAKGEVAPYRQEAFFNRRQVTPLSALLSGTTLKILNTYPHERGGAVHDEDERGDGTVPSFASVPIEWDDTHQALALADKHAAMHSATAARDSIFNWLRPIDVRARKGASLGDSAVVELNVPAAIPAGADLAVEAAALVPTSVTIHAEDMENGTVKTQPLMLPGDGIHRHAIFRRPVEGVHRITAVPADGLLPSVSDYVLVVEK